MRANILLIASIIPCPYEARKTKKKRNSQNICSYYMLNQRMRCIYLQKQDLFKDILQMFSRRL